MDWEGCVHSTPQHGGMDEETAAGRPAGGTGGTDCPESGGSSPEEGRRRTMFVVLVQNTSFSSYCPLLQHTQHILTTQKPFQHTREKETLKKYLLSQPDVFCELCLPSPPESTRCWCIFHSSRSRTGGTASQSGRSLWPVGSGPSEGRPRTQRWIRHLREAKDKREEDKKKTGSRY